MCIDNVFIISQVFLHTQKLFVSGWRDSFGSEYLLLFLKPILEFPAPISFSQLPITLITRYLKALLASRDIVLRFSYHTLAYSKLNVVQNKKKLFIIMDKRYSAAGIGRSEYWFQYGYAQL